MNPPPAMKTNHHRSPATSASSSRRSNGAGKDEFHLVPFVPFWRTNDGKRKLDRLPRPQCSGWIAEARADGSVITDAVKRVPADVHSISHSALRIPRSALEPAFTRAELLITLAVLSLLVAIVLPALAHDRARSARILCANNLRQIGTAFQLWGNDHADQPPWEIRPDQGGTMQHTLGVNAWLHFSWISNELNSARVLFCPSDTGRPAEDFSFSPNGGYLHSNNRNQATSYFLSHAFSGGQFVMFAGDRNFQTPNGFGGCSRFPQASFANLPNLPGWDTNLHNQAGNIVRLDGRVNQYSNDELRSAAQNDPLSDRGQQSVLHILKPR